MEEKTLTFARQSPVFKLLNSCTQLLTRLVAFGSCGHIQGPRYVDFSVSGGPQECSPQTFSGPNTRLYAL